MCDFKVFEKKNPLLRNLHFQKAFNRGLVNKGFACLPRPVKIAGRKRKGQLGTAPAVQAEESCPRQEPRDSGMCVWSHFAPGGFQGAALQEVNLQPDPPCQGPLSQLCSLSLPLLWKRSKGGPWVAWRAEAGCWYLNGIPPNTFTGSSSIPSCLSIHLLTRPLALSLDHLCSEKGKRGSLEARHFNT